MDGMVPVSLFENNCKSVRDDRHPIIDGILPMRLLLCKFSTDNIDKVSMDKGIELDNRFECIIKLIK